jgi:hypothetical protein
MRQLTQKLYSLKNKRKDVRLNDGVGKHRQEILGRSLSPFILRNTTLMYFVDILNTAILNILKGPAYLKNYKNFTTKKDDEYVR